VHEQLLHYLQKRKWHFRLRLPADTLVHLSTRAGFLLSGICVHQLDRGASSRRYQF
jgi:hypothetical protein